MSTELNLRFPNPEQVVIRFGDGETAALSFQNPLTTNDHKDIRWYVETYAAHSLGDPDDSEAARIRDQLPVWGKALFDAVFGDPAARRWFNAFQDADDSAKLITVSAEHPAILALPWELLHESTAPDGAHLFHEQISIRRRFAGAGQGRQPIKINAKDRLHLLFVISRPVKAGFIDPRADAGAVMDALEQFAPGRITTEFLYPPTLPALLKRLQEADKPTVDIMHFDGHGRFDTATGMGYLLFENTRGFQHLVSADRLGDDLYQHGVALAILSACQSATLDDQQADPLGSVATGLLAKGVPAVLAMTYSVLVATSEALFGAFYQALVQGRTVGQALDYAREHINEHPEKFQVRRGSEWVWLKLHDWFVPTLYQNVQDEPLLIATARAFVPVKYSGQFPERPKADFFGRYYDLWRIERGFAGAVLRITITGFGGQGKTALALEAGRWLVRTGLFRAAVFVSYAGFQGIDAVAVACNEIGAALYVTLVDTASATQALRETPTLVILDNLETLPADALQELLDAAKEWSEAGGSRVLLTTRTPDFGHPAYQVEGTLIHRRIQLDGLGNRDQPDAALEWFAALQKLPPAPTMPTPKRDALIKLFDRVQFHPLSIRVLAAQLKTCRIAGLGERLEALLQQADLPTSEDMPAGLVASLRLSLDRLKPSARELLPRLGVFQGGAMENLLLMITEIPEAEWPTLRRQLEAAALLEAGSLPDVNLPFLRFHPTLAPLLWAELDKAQQEQLSAAYRARYCHLASWLYYEDTRNPHAVRAIARRELPNLLHAVDAALRLGEAEAVDFANSVIKFLTNFGLQREVEHLVGLAHDVAKETGSYAWYLAQTNRGEFKHISGQVEEATRVFQTVLQALGETSSYERAVTLGRLGRCLRAGGRSDIAAERQKQALAVLDTLEQTDSVKQQRGVCLTDLADVLADLGRYPEARQAYEAGLAIVQELNDLHQQGVVLGQLGTLALNEGNTAEAINRYQAVLALFKQLREPTTEAIVWHQLGLVYQEAQQWGEAEHCYRESAQIKEAQGDLRRAARTWNQLAMLNESTGKLEAAEQWYRKAIEDGKDNSLLRSRTLHNLANLLQDQLHHLAEARALAEQALSITQTLDPGTAEIWKTYNILAQIADREASADAAVQTERRQAARAYRRLALGAYRAFPGSRVMLKQRARLILAAVAACTVHEKARSALAQHQAAMRQAGSDWAKLADALDRLLAGERDAATLCEGLDFDTGLIMETILQGIADPASLENLTLPPD